MFENLKKKYSVKQKDPHEKTIHHNNKNVMVNNVLSEVINSMSNIYGWWTKGHLRIESSSDILLSIYFIHHHHKGYKLHYTLGKNTFVFSKKIFIIPAQNLFQKVHRGLP